jgi:hypothetical protein
MLIRDDIITRMRHDGLRRPRGEGGELLAGVEGATRFVRIRRSRRVRGGPLARILFANSQRICATLHITA